MPVLVMGYDVNRIWFQFYSVKFTLSEYLLFTHVIYWLQAFKFVSFCF